MKKIFTLLLTVTIVLSLSACGGQDTINQNSSTNSTSQEQTVDNTSENTSQVNETSDNSDEKSDFNSVANDFASIEELEQCVSEDVKNTVETLKTDYEKTTTEIDTYDKFVNNNDKIEDFYKEINTANEQFCIRMYEYSLAYAQMIMSSDESNKDKYNDFEDIYDCIYEDAGEELYDGIYDGVLEDLYDAYYDGILDDAKDSVSYDDWYDVRSDEYDRWYDTRSDVYDTWYDTRTDIYEFVFDTRSELYDNDIEKVNEKIAEFEEEIKKLKAD